MLLKGFIVWPYFPCLIYHFNTSALDIPTHPGYIMWFIDVTRAWYKEGIQGKLENVKINLRRGHRNLGHFIKSNISVSRILVLVRTLRKLRKHTCWFIALKEKKSYKSLWSNDSLVKTAPSVKENIDVSGSLNTFADFKRVLMDNKPNISKITFSTFLVAVKV